MGRCSILDSGSSCPPVEPASSPGSIPCLGDQVPAEEKPVLRQHPVKTEADRHSQAGTVQQAPASKAYATLGEMMDVFRDVFGEYNPSWGY